MIRPFFLILICVFHFSELYAHENLLARDSLQFEPTSNYRDVKVRGYTIQ